MGAATAISEMDVKEHNLSRADLKSHRIKWRRVMVLLLCLAASWAWGKKLAAIQGGTPGFDFGELYYGARTAILHRDPYQPNVVDTVFRQEGGVYAQGDQASRIIAPIVIQIDVYLPTALLLVAPLAHVSYAVAHELWLLLTAGLLGIAGYMMWALADPDAPALCGWLIAIMLADCQMMFMAGNSAGLVVALSVMGAWCFMTGRWGAVGVVLFAASLAVKPHDVGFIWLYFLLSGGVLRNRALQTLGVTLMIGLAAAIWIAPVSPHWLPELHRNHVLVSVAGGSSDPAPTGMTSGTVGSIIDLQAAVSMLFGRSEAYDLATWLILGPLFAGCLWIALRRRNSLRERWLGLAAISVLSLLPVYHRPYDAKLLLLTLPACAMLWAGGGMRRWCASGFTIAAVLITCDVPRAIFVCFFEVPSPSGPKSAFLTSLTPVVLLATACFYLWEYWRLNRGEAASASLSSADLKALSPAS